MTSTQAFAIVLAGCALVGCSPSPDVDFSPMMPPVEQNTEAIDAVELTEAELAALAEMKAETTGMLSPLLSSPTWTGHRIRVTGIKGGLPVTENIGLWHIVLVPTAEKSVVKLTGLLFAKDFDVKLDLKREVLIVDDTEFEGKRIEGKSPIFGNVAFEGVTFEKTLGPTMGKASILLLEDGRVAMDFHKVIINGQRAGEYGALSPDVADK